MAMGYASGQMETSTKGTGRKMCSMGMGCSRRLMDGAIRLNSKKVKLLKIQLTIKINLKNRRKLVQFLTSRTNKMKIHKDQNQLAN